MLINAKKILKYALEGKFVDNTISRCMVELLQNSRRSGAKNVNISIKNNILEYSDDGSGVKNWISLVTLGDSHWDDKIIASEDPAGFGLFSLYSAADTICISSSGDSITIKPEKLLEDSYSEHIGKQISTFKTSGSGIQIKAYLKEILPADDYKTITEYIKYFPLKIVLNGNVVKTISPEEYAKSNNVLISTTYGGDNPLYITAEGIEKYLVRTESRKDILIVYHGEIINTEKMFYLTNYGAFFIRDGSPLDPVLPYRNGLVDNDKKKKFYKFIEDEIEKYLNSIDLKKYHLYLYRQTDDDPTEIDIVRKMIEWNRKNGAIIEFVNERQCWRNEVVFDTNDVIRLIITQEAKYEDIKNILDKYDIELLYGKISTKFGNKWYIDKECLFDEKAYPLRILGSEDMIEGLPEIKLKNKVTKFTYVLEPKLSKYTDKEYLFMPYKGYPYPIIVGKNIESVKKAAEVIFSSAELTYSLILRGDKVDYSEYGDSEEMAMEAIKTDWWHYLKGITQSAEVISKEIERALIGFDLDINKTKIDKITKYILNIAGKKK